MLKQSLINPIGFQIPPEVIVLYIFYNNLREGKFILRITHFSAKAFFFTLYVSI